MNTQDTKELVVSVSKQIIDSQMDLACYIRWSFHAKEEFEKAKKAFWEAENRTQATALLTARDRLEEEIAEWEKKARDTHAHIDRLSSQISYYSKVIEKEKP